MIFIGLELRVGSHYQFAVGTVYILRRLIGCLADILTDVVVHNAVDGAVFLQFFESAVDILKKLLVILCQTDRILFLNKRIVQNLQVVVCLYEFLSRLGVDDHTVNLSRLQCLNSFASLAVTLYGRSLCLIVGRLQVACGSQLNADGLARQIVLGFYCSGYGNCHGSSHSYT